MVLSLSYILDLLETFENRIPRIKAKPIESKYLQMKYRCHCFYIPGISSTHLKLITTAVFQVSTSQKKILFNIFIGV